MKNFYQTARLVALIAAAFVLWLGGLLALQHWRYTTALPLVEQQLAQLKATLPAKRHETDFLATLRELDFYYRRAYLTNQDDYRRGINLLFIGLGVFLCANAIAAATQRYLPPPPLPVADASSPAAGRLLVALIVVGAGLSSYLYLVQSASSPSAKHSAPTSALNDAANNWSQFRGALATLLKLPPTLPAQPTWQITTPRAGFSSPIIWNDKIFLTAADKHIRTLYAYSLADGKLLWEQNTSPLGTGAPLPEVTDDTGYAASTPAADGARVYAIFATGQLICTDHAGVLQWQYDFPLPEIMYGYASSLALYADKLIVQMDTETAQTLYAFDVTNGKILWQTPREAEVSWATPLIIADDERQMIITATGRGLTAFALADGKILWNNDCLTGEIATSPFYHAGKIYYAIENAAALALDADTGKILWQNNNTVLPNVASPLLVADILFLFTGGGTIVALDAHTGQVLWEREHGEGFYATPLLLAENKILAADKHGDLNFIRANREKYEVAAARIALGESIVATPAIRSPYIVVRTWNKLIALRVE